MLPLLSLLHCSLLIFFSTYNGNDHSVTFVPFLVFVFHSEKHKSFLAPIRGQNGGDHLELVW